MRSFDQRLPEFIIKLTNDPLGYEKQLLREINLHLYSEFIFSMIPKLKKQTPVLELDDFVDVHIIGDLHGSVRTIKRIIDHFIEGRISKLVFLGDYVDRGENSLAVLLMVLALRQSFPKEVVILKGNHEAEKMNRKYGFKKQLDEVFDGDGNRAMEISNMLFNCLSVAAITSRRSLCVHGGIANTDLSLLDINEIAKPYNSFTASDSRGKELMKVIEQIQWNDPKEKQPLDFDFSLRGGWIYTFNETATKIFLEKNKLSRVIRAHESDRGAYQIMFGGKLIHVFTAEPYFGKIPKGAMIHETPYASFVLDLNLKEIKALD